MVFDSNTFGKYEESLINNFNNAKLPYILLHSKSDIQSLNTDLEQKLKNNFTKNIIDFSIKDLTKRDEIFELIKSTIPDLSLKTDTLLGDIIKKGDLILLVSTIDAGTPAGRLILPQVQTIRDVLDNDAISIILKQDEIKDFLEKSKVKPNLVITDSQIFDTVSKLIDKSILLTSFSIVLARQKGDFQAYIEGTPHIENLKDGDNILILESCSHHVSCDDIGRKKIPTLLRNYTKKELNFTVVSGLDNIPEAIQNYALVIQCGGCVLTKKQVQNRLKPAVDAKIPVTNYGMLIAYVHGIFERAVQVFKK